MNKTNGYSKPSIALLKQLSMVIVKSCDHVINQNIPMNRDNVAPKKIIQERFK
jgi:hypothetical protein